MIPSSQVGGQREWGELENWFKQTWNLHNICIFQIYRGSRAEAKGDIASSVWLNSSTAAKLPNFEW
jgi:hypothetical protein